MLAAASYPLDPPADWAAHAAKIAAWVAEAAGAGADLLVFPEYAAMELAALDGAAAAADLGASLRAADRWRPRADALVVELAARYGVHILAGSGPVSDPALGPRPVNRATLAGPDGLIGVQDKQVMTQFERRDWDVGPGGPLRVFDTALGRLGVLICYDAEFPALGRALVAAGAEILLVPSCTDTWAGYSRVRIGAMARALEGQCVVVQAPTVGPAPWSPAIDENHGAAAIYGPPDLGFPETGVIAEAAPDTPGWTYARVARAAIARVRAEGAVRNHAHWPESVVRAALCPPGADLP